MIFGLRNRESMFTREQFETGRLVPLEAYRGIAAIIVLVHHFFLAFSPKITGFIASDRVSESLIGAFYFVFFSGDGAVHFFFVLSGFVLCWSYFNQEDTDKIKIAFLKRYPRLAGIVIITTVISFALFYFDLYFFSQAASLQNNGNRWLALFGYSMDPATFEPSLLKAIYQGASTFFTGSSVYNGSLWTMQHEFFGSIVVYLTAIFVSKCLAYRYLPFFFGVLALLMIFYSPLMLPFAVGIYLSIQVARRRPLMPLWFSLACVATGLYLLGYMIPEKAFFWVRLLPSRFEPSMKIVLHSLGAALIIFGTMVNGSVFRSLNGGFFRFLGRISFPIYLVHMLVLGSASSYVFIEMRRLGFQDEVVLVATFAVTIFLSIVASIPLAKLDENWVAFLNKSMSRFR
jgi:peptidoglycan/LPS O-acetylase OafA/YrhL